MTIEWALKCCLDCVHRQSNQRGEDIDALRVLQGRRRAKDMFLLEYEANTSLRILKTDLAH